MNEHIGWIWGVITLGFSVCITGFFFLNKRINELSDHIDTSKSFLEKIEKLVTDVGQIRTALIGDFNEKGLVGKHYDLERKVNEVSAIVEKLKTRNQND